ncbi:hypothetical protein FRC01_004450 [Tulasnella sp. 417]|nr:hypothetical protein FRC01_004450 [Tulasnella sp. 417]
MEENGPRAKGGQGVIVVGTLAPTEGSVEAQPAKRLVAVKKIEWNYEDSERSKTVLKSFVNELSLIATLSHQNIVKLLGFVEDVGNGAAWIVLLWEENGNLRELLQSGEWDIPERVSLIQDTVKGLEYLHTAQPPICHGDLKSLKILVSSSYHAIITDFGSARIRRIVTTGDSELDSTRQGTKGRLNPGITSPQAGFNAADFDFTLTGPGFSLGWTAPEVLDDGVQDLPSDMWAMGWICWEVSSFEWRAVPVR